MISFRQKDYSKKNMVKKGSPYIPISKSVPGSTKSNAIPAANITSSQFGNQKPMTPSIPSTQKPITKTSTALVPFTSTVPSVKSTQAPIVASSTQVPGVISPVQPKATSMTALPPSVPVITSTNQKPSSSTTRKPVVQHYQPNTATTGNSNSSRQRFNLKGKIINSAYNTANAISNARQNLEKGLWRFGNNAMHDINKAGMAVVNGTKKTAQALGNGAYAIGRGVKMAAPYVWDATKKTGKFLGKTALWTGGIGAGAALLGSMIANNDDD